MPPCCQIPPGPYGHFLLGLKYDTEQFSKYVGNGSPLGIRRHAGFLTSGLHLEMKLWPPHGHLPCPPYKINDARHNSWQAMRQKSVNTFNPAERNAIFDSFPKSFPRRKSCALVEYDLWILKEIDTLCIRGLGQPGAVGGGGPGLPTTLATIGKTQKLINIYVKYQFCWQIAGQWQNIPAPGHFVSYKPPFSPQDFLCALHAPIDRQILKSLKNLAIGHHLKKQGALAGENLIQSSDGAKRPWSKLDCLRTYYGFQLALRRIAMRTWPKECGCFGLSDAIQKCGDMFQEEFSKGQECQGPDWIEIAKNIPDDIIDSTIEELKKTP
jgi:hypothetical protein